MTTPAGIISLPIQNLRVSVADCDAFRTWVGASGDDAQEQARARIHNTALPPPDGGGEYTLNEMKGLRPYAIIGMAPDDRQPGFQMSIDSVGAAGFDYELSGRLAMLFEQDVPDEIKNDPGEIDIRFLNTCGAILAELGVLSGQGGYLAWSDLDAHGPFRTHPEFVETYGDVVQLDMTIDWQGR